MGHSEMEESKISGVILKQFRRISKRIIKSMYQELEWKVQKAENGINETALFSILSS